VQLFIVHSLNKPMDAGYTYVFSRWISRYIMPIPCDKSYSGSHCTHQLHISWLLDTPLQCKSAMIGTSQFLSALLSLDWPCSIQFHPWLSFSALLISRRRSLANTDAILFHWIPPFPCSSIPTSASSSGLCIQYWILHSVPHRLPPLSALLR